MSIEYTYKITSADQASRCMEVVYTAPNRQTMHIGARLPYAGETLETVVNMYAPLAYWQEQETQVQDVAIGATGVIGKAPPTTLATVKTEKLAEIAAARYANEVAGVLFSGVVFGTDRESRSALHVALLALQSGAVQTVDWKIQTGTWRQLNLVEMTALVHVVIAHVQNSFLIEKQLAEEVLVASTVEAVEAVKWPR